MKREMPKPEDLFRNNNFQLGSWLVANIETNAEWTVKVQKTHYLGQNIYIIPIMQGYYPSIAMLVDNENETREARLILMRFLSALMWMEGKGAIVEHFTGGNLPRPMGRSQQRGYAIRSEFDLLSVPELTEEKSTLAVALMREGRILNHPAYSFLSFYRALEVCIESKQREDWINSSLAAVTDHSAKTTIDNLLKSGISMPKIHEYLYKSCRHAIAHANRRPVVHPDDFEDTRRLYQVVPLMEALAQIAIEQKLGVKTSYTVWAEHFYELEGWKSKFTSLFDHITGPISGICAKLYGLPSICLRLRERDPYTPFEEMEQAELCFLSSEKIIVSYTSYCKLFSITFLLDMSNERFIFDISNGIYTSGDDGSHQYAKSRHELERFTRDYFMNGRIIICESETKTLLSRKDAFEPVNVLPDFSRFDASIAEWKVEAERRSKLPS